MSGGANTQAVSNLQGGSVRPSDGTNRQSDASAEATVVVTPDAAAQITDIVHYDYEALLERLRGDCQRIVATAHSEAELLRDEAAKEARGRVASAHREEVTILARAADRQAAIYRELQDEVHRRLEDAERQRASIVAAAHADADEIRRAARDTQAQAEAALQAAHDEARVVLSDAQHVAGDAETTSTTSDDERLFWSSNADDDLDALLHEVRGDQQQPHHEEISDRQPRDTSHQAPTAPSSGATRRKRVHRWSRRR